MSSATSGSSPLKIFLDELPNETAQIPQKTPVRSPFTQSVGKEQPSSSSRKTPAESPNETAEIPQKPASSSFAKHFEKKQLHKVDFSSELLEFHVSGSQGTSWKTFKFPMDTFKRAIPHFENVYKKNSDGIYAVSDIGHCEFEKLLHWILYGEVRAYESDLTPTKSLDGHMVQAQSWYNLSLLYIMAENLKVTTLQNALINEMIDVFTTTHAGPHPQSMAFCLRNSSHRVKLFTSTGWGKLFVDMVVYTKNAGLRKRMVKDWAAEDVMPKQFFVDLAIGLTDKKDIPPYETDKSQYHVPPVDD